MRQYMILALVIVAVMASTAAVPATNREKAETSAEIRLSSFQKHMELAGSSVFRNLKWRNVGPMVMSGRTTDIAVPESLPFTFYVAAASGGVWKTDNNGTTWTPIFDHEASASIGDIAVAPSNPNILWVGTGENNSSRSSYSGSGVYKSLDGGQTWEHVGLTNSHHIGRILIHPKDPEVVYIASMGHLYTPGGEKGVFKTVNGGKTWAHVLSFPDQPHTGVIDLVMDPKKPDILYAAAWERFRSAWNLQESGRGSGIFKSTNGGQTWKPLTQGFPSGEHIGRIGLAIPQSNQRIVYALLDNQTPRPEKSKLGVTLKDLKTMTTEEFLALGEKKIRKLMGHYGVPEKIDWEKIRQDLLSGKITPADIARTLYDANRELVSSSVVGGEVYRSKDAGKSWEKMSDKPIDSFYNTYGYYFGEIRADPKNQHRVFILGVPLLVSMDGGKTFKRQGGPGVHADHHAFWINPKLPQHIIDGNDGGINVSYDGGKNWKKFNNMPIGQFYTVNVDMAVPYNIYGGLQDNGVYTGTSRPRARRPEPWKMVLFGDGGYVQIDPEDNNVIYTEYQFGNMFRVEREPLKFVGIKPFPELGEPPYRFNWQAPILISPHNRFTLYVGANKVLKSVDRGETWVEISPDLTLGGKPGDVPYGTITSLDVSVLRPRLLVVGTDDGLVWVSCNDGGQWEKITRGLPENKWVSRVIASRHDADTVYVALNGYRDDDFTTYLYRSRDLGKTWESIQGNLPPESVNVIREDPKRRDILYLGTDVGVWTTLDNGMIWHSLRCNLPTLYVHDLVVHPRDGELVIGTHGRSIYIFNAKIIESLTHDILKQIFYVFPVDPVRLPDSPWARVSITFNYYLKSQPKEFTMEILDLEGQLLKTLKKAPTEKGINFIAWDLMPDPPKSTEEKQTAEDDDIERVPPGDYTLRIRFDGDEVLQRFTVLAAKN